MTIVAGPPSLAPTIPGIETRKLNARPELPGVASAGHLPPPEATRRRSAPARACRAVLQEVPYLHDMVKALAVRLTIVLRW
jgi:hypothetical protein